MTYKITKIETTHSSIANLKDSFILDSKTGELKIKFQPADYMMGKFIIDIMAEDEIGETGETQVNVFLIALDNKVYFTFSNSPEFIGEKRETVRKCYTLSAQTKRVIFFSLIRSHTKRNRRVRQNNFYFFSSASFYM